MEEKKEKVIETATSSFREVTLEILSAGHYKKGMADADALDIATRYIGLNIFTLVGFIIFLPFTVGLALLGTTPVNVILLDAGFCMLLLGIFLLARTKVSFYVPGSILVYFYAAFCCYMLLLHPSGGPAAALWSIIVPLMAYYVLGKYGIWPTGITTAVMIYVFQTNSDFYTVDFGVRCLIIYTFTAVYALFSFRRMAVLGSSLMTSRAQLKNELDEVETMKDNLDVGIFILDEKFQIQPFYSKHLPNVIGKKELEKLDFFSLLTNSMQKKEIDSLRDFLEMVLLGVHDSETLRDVNPLQKFKYTLEGMNSKILSITFSQIKRSNDSKVILCVARDITVESELEEKLAQEEQFRQAEMKAMFEVMHVPPQILTEFLDEVDFEFANMNNVLKDSTRDKKEVYKELFQSIHALKSDALVIGLDSPAERFHQFEEKLSMLLESEDYSYETLLEVIFELERVMDIADNLKGILSKMESFSDANKQLDSSEIFLQRVRNTISKAQKNTDKKAFLKVNTLDWAAVGKDQRKVIKEVVMQLTRNSMAHGIEDQAIRKQKGKAEEGCISISLEKKDTKFVLEFYDDGAGIDFAKIKEQAVAKKLLKEDASLDNRTELIKTIFMAGFSTAGDVTMQAGRGIGLNLVAERVKKYKGNIKVKSSQDKGTKFIVEIPC